MKKSKTGVILIFPILISLIFGAVVLARTIFNESDVDRIANIRGDITDRVASLEDRISDRAAFIQDEIIVKFKGDIEPFRVIKVPAGKISEEIARYRQRFDVVYSEPNYIAYALMTPNDPYYSYQWHLNNSEYGGINIEPAWDISTGAGVTVAIVDTGIAYEKYSSYCQAPDLAQTNFVPGYDFVYNDSHANDDNNHGTHVAGTVAQSTNNNLGVAGIAFGSCLMPVKVLDKYGSGSYSNVAKGIRYAADNEAKVINLSLGGTAPSNTIRDAVKYAYEKGVTVVAACGNENSSNCLYPAAYNDYVIAVGATQYDEKKAPYSNYGSSLDIVAPGGNTSIDQNGDGYGDGVLQQTFSSSRQPCNFSYYFFQGSSMAAPHVSGVAALVIAKGNATMPDEVRTALEETAEDLGTVGRDDTFGYGLVNAYAALNWTAAPACTIDTDCDDGLYCNGAETCQSGVCQTGTPPCSDGVNCTVDNCDEVNNTCTFTPNDNACSADGWFDTGNTRWVEDTQCTEKEQKEQEYKDYYCHLVLDCQYNIIGSQWVDTGATRDKPESTACTNGACCSGACLAGITGCPTSVMCWSGDNEYLYRNSSQARKFCKCASGNYGYNSYNYTWARKTVFQYVDSGDNNNWEVTSRSSYLPIYQVTCLDNNTYATNKNYYSSE